MKQADEITLKAFLIAVEETYQTLPETELIKLQAIADNIEDNLGKLDTIVESNPELDAVYQEIRILLQDGYNKRNKGGFPKIDQDAEQDNTEIPNEILIANKLSETSKSILKMKGKTLIARFRGLFSKREV